MLRWVKASKLNVLNATLQLMRKVARVRGCLIWYSKDSLPIVQMYSNEIKRVTKKWLNVIKKAELLDKGIVPFSFFFIFLFSLSFSLVCSSIWKESTRSKAENSRLEASEWIEFQLKLSRPTKESLKFKFRDSILSHNSSQLLAN